MADVNDRSAPASADIAAALEAWSFDDQACPHVNDCVLNVRCLRGDCQCQRDLAASAAAAIRTLSADCESLAKALQQHNEGCQQRCGVGDQEAVTCGYRPYFEGSGRRCPNCPVHDMIDAPRSEG